MNVRNYLTGSQNALPQVYVLSDSITRDFDANYLSAESGKNVVVLSFPGAKLEYLMQLAEILCGSFVEKCILMGGTCSLSSKDGYPKLGSNQLFQKVCAFESRFSRFNSSIMLILCHILNRVRNAKNQRILRHICRFNAKLDNWRSEGNCADSTMILPLAPLPDSFFSDGLHLARVGTEHMQLILLSGLSSG